ncbi:MAG: thiamine biosynthesis protein [Candidatus Nitrosotenuis sp.]
MNEPAFVVVFPSIFAKNKKNLLIQNIKKILKIQNQQFGRITTDDDLIIIEANDPVFASSAINLLFGIDQVSIARRVENKFNVAVSAIAKVGTNLLLRGEIFHVKVEGRSSGYLPKDVEIAGTSALIEKVVDMDCRPGTEQKHDKMIHCFLTGKNAYISIFLDKGHGGIPYNSQGEQVLCCVFDEISAISCLETIKQGFDVKILVCYNTDANLMELVKIINRIIPRMLIQDVTLDFIKIPIKQDTTKAIQQKILLISKVLCQMAKKLHINKVCLSLSPLVFPVWLIEQNLDVVTKNKLTPWIALAGLDNSIIETAKEIGLGKYLSRIEKFGTLKFAQAKADVSGMALDATKTRQTITIRIGPNNIHDILDSIKH